MAILKISTKMKSFNEVSKALQDIEKHLNELDKSVNTKAESEVSDKDGKTGDIRTTRNADRTFTFEVRTDEGWKTPTIGDSSIKFTDKPSSYSQQIVKSIDEIEADDTTTGDTQANKNIFDEKSSKFILPRPDYESSWTRFIWDYHRAAHDVPQLFTHGLNVFPKITLVYFAPGQGSGANDSVVADSEITWFTTAKDGFGDGHDKGLVTYTSKPEIRIHAGDTYTLVGSDFLNTGAINGSGVDVDHREEYTDGSIKVLCWK